MALHALHTVAKDTPDRLVLRERALGPVLASLFFMFIGTAFAVATVAAVDGNHVFPAVATAVMGALSLWAAFGLARRVLRGANRIVFDRVNRQVLFVMSHEAESFRVPFEAADCVELRHERRAGHATPKRPNPPDVEVYLLFLVLRGGDEFKLTELGDAAPLRELALKAGRLIGAPVSDAIHGRRRSPAAAIRGAPTVERMTTAGEQPAGLRHESAAGTQVYRWRVLPRHPGWVVFFLVLFALSVLPAPLVLVALLSGGKFDAEVLMIAFVLCLLAYKAGPPLLIILLGRCTLQLSGRELDYEVRVLGVPVPSQRHRVSARDIAAINMGDPKKGGLEVRTTGGKAFFLKLPVGGGAFSQADLLWMRRRWLKHLSLPTAP